MARLSFKKRLLKSPTMHSIMACIATLLIRLIYITARVQKIVPATAYPYMTGEKPAIFCFWHGRMVMHLMVKPRGRPVFVLSSQHTDGSAIVAIMRWFRVGTVRGSASRGSAKALRNLFKVTHAGGNIAITPDGPRGPTQKAAFGAAFIAAKTGYPIVPVTFSAARFLRFRSWDKFMLPKPFTRILFVIGEPIVITADSDASIRTTTATLETALNDITVQADALCGVTS
jgi:lysophospholipid acyltransferase (LPLAT)-like uncharacterized protein